VQETRNFLFVDKSQSAIRDTASPASNVARFHAPYQNPDDELRSPVHFVFAELKRRAFAPYQVFPEQAAC
jgi:hypothetical protein